MTTMSVKTTIRNENDNSIPASSSSTTGRKCCTLKTQIPLKLVPKLKPKEGEEDTRKFTLAAQFNECYSDEESKQQTQQKAIIQKYSKKNSKKCPLITSQSTKVISPKKFKTISTYDESRHKESEDYAEEEDCTYDRITNDNFYITTKGGINSYPRSNASIFNAIEKRYIILKQIN